MTKEWENKSLLRKQKQVILMIWKSKPAHSHVGNDTLFSSWAQDMRVWPDTESCCDHWLDIWSVKVAGANLHLSDSAVSEDNNSFRAEDSTTQWMTCRRATIKSALPPVSWESFWSTMNVFGSVSANICREGGRERRGNANYASHSTTAVHRDLWWALL